MQFFRDLSVRAKLFGGFGVVLVLSAILGVVMIMQIGSVNNGGVYLGKNALPSVQLVKQVGMDITDYRGAQLAALIDRKPSAIASDLAKAQSDANQIGGLLKQYGSMLSNATDKQVWQQVQQDWTGYVSATGQLSHLATNPKTSLATMSSSVDGTRASFLGLQQATVTWANDNVAWGNEKVKSNASTYSSAKTIGIGLLVLVIVLGFGIAFLVSRQIRGSVVAILERVETIKDRGAKRIREALERLAEGDLTDEIQMTTSASSGFPRDELGDVQRLVEETRDEMVASLEAYNATRERLAAMIGTVVRTADHVSTSSHEVASTSDESGRATGEIANAIGEIAHGAERQVQMVEQARRSAQEVAHAVTDAAEHATRTAEVAHEAREVAREGLGAAEQATAAMGSVRDSSHEVADAIRELASKSEQIGQIVQTITGIAEQTNLLALNAAIEAARAGEQGRGFAVVAEEVRKLAEDAQSAAEEISQLIGTIQAETSHAVEVVEAGAQRTEHGTSVVEQTREAFLKIGSAVDDMGTRIEQIAAASEQIAASAHVMQESMGEVATVAEESSAATEEVSASTEQTSASTQQISATAQELAGNARALNELMGQFKIKD